MKKLNLIFLLLITFSFIPKHIFAKVSIDSLEAELRISQKDTNQVKLLYQLSSSYLDINTYKGIEFGKKGLELAEEINWNSGKAMCYNALGANSLRKSDYPKALEYYLNALKINKGLLNKYNVASNFGSLGNIYENMSIHSKALDYFNQALTIYKDLSDSAGMARSMGNIGSVFYNQAEYSKALEYYFNSLKIQKRIGNKLGISINLTNIANIYEIESNYTKAIEYYNKATQINHEIKNKSGLGYDYGNIGGLYLSIAQKQIDRIEDDNLEKFMNKEINLNKSIEFTIKALAIFEETENLSDQSYFLNQLSEAYQLKGDYSKALEIYKKHIEIQTSLYSLEKANDIANLEAKQESELKDAEIEYLKIEQENQQFRVYVLIASVVLFIIALIFAFFRYNEKKKQSIVLSMQNDEIIKQKDTLEATNNQISASIRYAATIQNAILPWNTTLENSLKQYFIIYKPKDIVSGDSYWFQEYDGIKYLALIDCTGHGVPGAMLTVIASNVLDEAILSKKLKDTGEILTFMNKKVTAVLNQQMIDNTSRDGMEVALIAIKNDKLQFTGAGRPLYVCREKLEIFKTDRIGVAGNKTNIDYKFSSISLENIENINLFLTSDGYADQMNSDRKKYSTKKLLLKLDQIAKWDCKTQMETLENELLKHQGNEEQLDDITIWGIKL